MRYGTPSPQCGQLGHGLMPGSRLTKPSDCHVLTTSPCGPSRTSGAMGAAATVLAMCHRTLPPTANLDHQDQACRLDCVPLKARPAEINLAMVNAFGFGGHNSCLVLRSCR